MKKIALSMILGLLFMGLVNASCDYYVGDDEFDLPKITSSRVYNDGPSHKMYVACLYGLNGETGFESMIGTQDCRRNIETFNPDTPGEYNYKLHIVYRERRWIPQNHLWQTIDGGTDNSLDYNFEVCDIPEDSQGWEDFLYWVQSLFCSLFDWVCNPPASPFI